MMQFREKCQDCRLYYTSNIFYRMAGLPVKSTISRVNCTIPPQWLFVILQLMKKGNIPVYDICSIDDRAGYKDLLIERFDSYLSKHYEHLHRPHRHSFFHLVFFTKGKGKHTIDFAGFIVKPFQVYFMIPGQVHSWHFEGAMDGYIVHFNAGLFSSFLQQQHYPGRFSFFNGLSKDGVRQLPVAVQQQAIMLFEDLLKEAASKEDAHLDMIRIRLIEFFILTERNTVPGGQKKNTVQKPKLLTDFITLADMHYRDIKLPKEYALLLHVTPNHLNAICREVLGKTAGDIIRERILLEAKRLLTNAGMSISEIAYALNFKDNAYFNRLFKKETGFTPETFRKKSIEQ